MLKAIFNYYVTDFKSKNKNSRYKKSPVVATELLLLVWLEKIPTSRFGFNSSLVRSCMQ